MKTILITKKRNKYLFEKLSTIANSNGYNDIDFFFSESKESTEQILKKFSENNGKLVICMGGDGLINSTLKSILEYNLELSIIPFGSGNGFARHLKIPLGLKALKNIKDTKEIEVDVLNINNQYYALNLLGIGFDAVIARAFEKNKIRGYLGYFLIISNQIFKIKSNKIEITVNNKTITNSFLMINIANGSQFGLGLKFSPNSLINDGLMDINLVYFYKNFFDWIKLLSNLIFYNISS